MAQRTVHYLFGELLCERVGIKDRNRFMLGSLLPDACGVTDRDRTHFISRDGQFACCDIEQFRSRFAAYMHDGLYPGYYMHLIEDAFYRVFINANHIRRPDSREGIAFLHNDYHLLNVHIVRRYGVSFDVQMIPVLANEPIYSIAAFDADDILRLTQEDFLETPTGSTQYLTEDMLDRFIAEYLPKAEAELRAISCGGASTLRPEELRWNMFG